MATDVNFGTQRYFAFDPRTIPTCVLWLDGADSNVMFSDVLGLTPVAPGGTIARWSDKTTNANDAIQSTASQRPTYTASGQNGSNVVTFTGSSSNDLSFAGATTFPPGTAGYSAFLVGKTTLGATAQTFFRWGGITAGSSFRLGANASSQLIQDYFGVGTSTDTASVSNTTFLFSSSSTTTTAGPYKNGTIFTTPTTYAYNFGTPALGILGSADTGLQYLTGFVAEVIVYTSNLSTFDRQQVEGYLAWKWGLSSSLPASQPFKRAPTTMRMFLPIDLTTPGLWLDAGDATTLTLAGSSVTVWKDKSGNVRDASGGVSPTYDATSNAVVFNGSTQYLLTPYSSSLQTEAIFITSYLSTASYANFPTMIGASGNGGRQVFIYNNGGFQVNIQNVANGPNTGANTSPTLQNALYTYTSTSNTPSNLINMFVNGAQLVTNASLGPFSNALTSQIGRWPGGNYWQGSLYEIVAFSNAVTAGQRQQMEGYLAWKWGTQSKLPAAHAYSKVRPSVPIFSPLFISNCVVWLDAADGTTVTSNANSIVTQVADKSGNGYTISNGYSAAETTGFVWNGATKFNTNYPSFYYNDVAQNRTLGTNTTISLTQPVTIFTVMQRVGAGSFQDPFDGRLGATATQRLFAFYFGGSDTYRIYAGNTLVQTGTLNVNGGVYSHVFNTTVSSVFENGTSIISGDVGTGTGLGITIGSRQTQNTESWMGHICEVLYYNRLLTTLERQRIEGYLAWKWGTQTRLPSTHPYAKFSP